MLIRLRNFCLLSACGFAISNLRYAYLLTSTSRNDGPLIIVTESSFETEEELLNVQNIRDKKFSDDRSNTLLTECMLKLEAHLTPLIKQWDLAKIPIPYSVKIVDNSFYVLSSLLEDRGHWRDDPYEYYCNNVAAKIISANRKGKPVLIVQCPQILDPNNTTLSNFSIRAKGNNTEEASYNLSMYDECERKDMQHHLNLPHAPPPKIGVTATFKGSRRKATEWAAYHHILGADHIWLYVNEDWNDGKDLPQRDYITWIPYNFHVVSSAEKKHYAPWEFFRVASMNDALWRAKRMDLDWLAVIDIDEYIYIPFDQKQRGNEHGNGTGTSLPRSLSSYLANQNNMGCSAIEMASVPFGSNLSIDNDGEQELLMDYVYRRKFNTNSTKRHRVKLIVDVKDVTSINIHYVGGDNGTRKCRYFHSKVEDIRLNHYKNPDKGVFNEEKVDTELEIDRSLMDGYHSLVMDELKKEIM
jgi:hypothetical protein